MAVDPTLIPLGTKMHVPGYGRSIAADVGHELELTVTWATGGTRVLLARVPPRRPPSIVRTDPPKGRTDVALGVRPTVVFSEPIDPASLSPTSLQLLQNGTPVPGSVALEPASAWSAVFTPASLLEPASTYELVVTRDIVDLNGDPLAETVRIPFTTTGITGLSAQIAFATEVSPGNGALYIANSDGSGLRQLHGGSTYYSRPRWSPDRRRIAFSRSALGTGVSGVFVIAVDGPGGLVRLADGFDPAWSPDGSRIAFASRAPTGGFGIHVMNADGSDIRRLTSPNDPSQCSEGSSANDLKPDWSPDGQKILFERQIHVDDGDDGLEFDCGLDGWGYVPNVYLVNADGTGVRRLRPLPWTTEDMDPAWAPDGHSIAFAVISPGRGLYIIDKDASSAARPVLAAIPGAYAVSPVWSPDSRELLVLSVSPPNNQLVIVELESGNTRVLGFPSVRGLLLDPAW